MRPGTSKKSRLGIALSTAVLLGSLSLGSVLAGEVTGKGDVTRGPENANSICVFSGQNDHPEAPLTLDRTLAPDGPGGRTQNWGQLVSTFGIPGNAPFNPGASCRGGSNPERER